MWKDCEELTMLLSDTSKAFDSKEEMGAPTDCPQVDSL
jgi:hypothetical protein